MGDVTVNVKMQEDKRGEIFFYMNLIKVLVAFLLAATLISISSVWRLQAVGASEAKLLSTSNESGWSTWGADAISDSAVDDSAYAGAYSFLYKDLLLYEGEGSVDSRLITGKEYKHVRVFLIAPWVGVVDEQDLAHIGMAKHGAVVSMDSLYSFKVSRETFAERMRIEKEVTAKVGGLLADLGRSAKSVSSKEEVLALMRKGFSLRKASLERMRRQIHTHIALLKSLKERSLFGTWDDTPSSMLEGFRESRQYGVKALYERREDSLRMFLGLLRLNMAHLRKAAESMRLEELCGEGSELCRKKGELLAEIDKSMKRDIMSVRISEYVDQVLIGSVLKKAANLMVQAIADIGRATAQKIREVAEINDKSRRGTEKMRRISEEYKEGIIGEIHLLREKMRSWDEAGDVFPGTTQRPVATEPPSGRKIPGLHRIGGHAGEKFYFGSRRPVVRWSPPNASPGRANGAQSEQANTHGEPGRPDSQQLDEGLYLPMSNKRIRSRVAKRNRRRKMKELADCKKREKGERSREEKAMKDLQECRESLDHQGLLHRDRLKKLDKELRERERKLEERERDLGRAKPTRGSLPQALKWAAANEACMENRQLLEHELAVCTNSLHHGIGPGVRF